MPTLLDEPVLSFAVSAEALEEALSDVRPVVSGGSGAMPILDNAHLELRDGTLYISATDLEVYVTRMVEVGGGIEGEALLPTDNLYQLLRTADGGDRIELTVSEDYTVTVEAKGGTFSEDGDSPEDYPERLGLNMMREEDGLEEAFTVSSSTLSELLKSATPFALNPHSGGKEAMKFVQVQIEEGILTVRATNGTSMYRGREEIGGQPDEGVTMFSTSLANQAARFDEDADVTASFEEQRAFLQSENKIVSGSLSNREPLNIDKIIPEEEGMFQFGMSSSALRNALMRAGCYTQEEGLCRFIIDKDRVRLKAHDVEGRAKMGERLPVEVDTPRVYGPAQIEAVFKVDTLRQCVGAFDSEDVKFVFYGTGRPAFIKAGDRVLVGAMTIKT